MRDIIAEARAAAAAGDEDEGVEGAAARAAARAAALGVAAASAGYLSLGGVDEHVWPARSCLAHVAPCKSGSPSLDTTLLARKLSAFGMCTTLLILNLTRR